MLLVLFFGTNSLNVFGEEALEAHTVTRNIATAGGYRNVTYVIIPMDGSFRIEGLVAADLLNRPTATLPEFAAAKEETAGDIVVIAPINFFNAGAGGTNDLEIVGGIFSQGNLVRTGYFDRGAGFDFDNNFFLFNAGFRDGYMMQGAAHLYYVYTAFNPFPPLIREGESLEISPWFGMREGFLTQNLRRAFMGQRENGTFIIGNTNSTMFELQDIALYLGLVNATSIDGGASVGIFFNGQVITSPGRQLASVMYITNARDPYEQRPVPSRLTHD